MKKTFTFKSLLVAAALLCGVTSAWAGDTTTAYDFEDGTTNPFVIADAARMSASFVDDATLGSKVLKYTCGNMNAIAFAYYNFSELAKTAQKVTVEFDFNIAETAGHELISLADADFHTRTGGGFTGKSNTGYGSNGAIFNFGCFRGGGANKFAVNSKQNDLACLGVWCHAKVVVDVVDKKVSYVISDNSGTELSSASDVAFLNSSASKCTQMDIYIGTNAGGNGVSIDNLSVTAYVDESIEMADYTVKYVDADGNEIKNAVIRNAQVGTKIALVQSDKDNVYANDKKYIYVSDDSESATVVSGGSSIVTVTFREAPSYHYVLNAIDASETFLTTLAEGDAFEGDKGYARGVKAFYKDGTLYSTENSGGFEVEFTEAGTKTLTYSANTEWSLFTEVENMKASASWAANGAFPSFYSNGVAVRFRAGAYAYTEPLEEGGTYTVTMWARNNSGSSVANLGLYYRDADGELIPVGKSFADWEKAQRIEKVVEGVGIPAGCSFVIKNESADYNNNLEMDYIFLKKTSDAAPALTKTVTIGANGYTTFASAYAVELPLGVKAYTAKVNETASAVVFTEVSGTQIPANTGVLLEGTAGDYSLAVSTDDVAALSNNDFKVNTSGAKFEAAENTTYFAMVKDATPLVFGKVDPATVAIPANKAYVAVTGVEAPAEGRLAATFGEATAIKGVETVEAADAAVYNLSGQRVKKAAKGVYIVNGKKAIVK